MHRIPPVIHFMYLPKASFAGGYDATRRPTAVSDKGDDNIILLTNIAARREVPLFVPGGHLWEGGERADD